MDTVWAAAVTLSGCHESKVDRMLQFANMGRLSHATFHRLTNKVIQPVVRDTYELKLQANREAAMAASPDGLIIAG